MFEHLVDDKTEKADLFNRGYPTVLDLAKLKCPCGRPFLSSEESVICSACGSATCSPECHDEFFQKRDKCLFSRNFYDDFGQKGKVQGLLGTKLANIRTLEKKNMPRYTQCSAVSARFMLSALGPTKNTVYLQRGYRIYGSPCVIPQN